MANEVRIKLTDEQKAKIKEATGKEMPEIRVGSLGDNPAVSAKTVSASKATRSASGRRWSKGPASTSASSPTPRWVRPRLSNST